MNYLGYDAFSPLYSSYLDSSYLHKKIHLFIKVDKNRYPAQYRGYYGTFSGVVDDDDETVLITGNDMTENYADTPVSTVKNRKPPIWVRKKLELKRMILLRFTTIILLKFMNLLKEERDETNQENKENQRNKERVENIIKNRPCIKLTRFI